MSLCWDLAVLCAIEPCLIYPVFFLVLSQPLLPLHILLITNLTICITDFCFHRSPKLKLWKTLLSSILGSSCLQNCVKERMNIHPQELSLQNHLYAFNYTSYRMICWVFFLNSHNRLTVKESPQV